MKLAAAILALACLTGCQDPQKLFKPPYEDQEISWGQPASGLQIGLAQRQYDLGTEPRGGMLYYSVHLRNVGQPTLKLLMPVKPKFGTPELPLAGDESVKVTLRYLDYPSARTAEFLPPNRPYIVQLGAGEVTSFEIRTTPGKFGARTIVPGKIAATYTNAQNTIDYGPNGGGPVLGLWTGSANSGPLSITPPATRPAP